MRQNSIITLTDHNKEEIEKLKQQREEMMKDFEKRKEGKQNYSKDKIFKLIQ